MIRAQRDGERLSAAQQVNWIPGDDDERRVLLRSTNENFLGSLARKAEEGSDVRRGADVAAEGTEAQQLAFIAIGVHQAAAVDRARKIEEGRQKELAEQEAKRSREIRGAAIAAALGRVATEFELTLSAERDLIYKIKTETPGTQMKLAAGIAYNSEKPADWRDFLSTGVHLARAADIAEQDRRDKEKREGEVRQILNDATFDKDTENATPEGVVGAIKDNVRYTWTFKFDDYVSGAEAGVRQLAREGFVFVKGWNGWASAAEPYRGLNTTWQDPRSGQFFEMQFHTEDSFVMNRTEHPLYEKWRNPASTPEERAAAREESFKLWGTVEMPENANLLTESRIRELVATI